MSDVVTVYATFANAEEAERIGRAAVDARLAACVNVLASCRSIYRWNDAVEDATEVPALFKTTAPRAEALVAEICRLHSYAVPAVTCWPVTHANPAYARWIIDQVS